MKTKIGDWVGFGWVDAICGMWRDIFRIRHVFALCLIVLTGGCFGQEYDYGEGGVDPKLAEALPARTVQFEVRSRAERNEEIPFFIRTPKDYVPGDRRVRRLLFLCPYIFQSGKNRINQCTGFLDLADERGWFVMSCSFKFDAKWARDEERSYFYPEGFSGKAVLKALDEVARKYPVDTERLLIHGLSGGAQFAHRFAMWVPDRVSAVVVNSASWFDSPGAEFNKVAWMVLVGESDPTYDASLVLASELRAVGAAPLLYPYAGAAHHGGGEHVEKLTVAWLKFHDERTRAMLGKPKTGRLAMAARDTQYVGNVQFLTYKENNRENYEDLPADHSVFLPSKEIADLWGKYEGEAGE